MDYSSMGDYILLAKNFLFTKGLELLGALIALYIGFKLANMISKIIRKSLKNKADKTILNYSETFTRIGLKILVILSIIEIVGIETTSFVAVLGGMSFAVGLALQGSLQNFAGGILLLILKPFKTDDFVKINDHIGTIESISIFYTYLNTLDNKYIIIPNSQIIDNSLVNYTKHDKRRIDITVGVDYGTNIKLVRDTIKKIVLNNEVFFKEPEPVIRLGNFGDSSIDFDIRVWTTTKNYIPARYDLIEAINDEFNNKGIEFPYPHMDVFLNKEIEG